MFNMFKKSQKCLKIKNRIEPQQNASPIFLRVAGCSQEISRTDGKRRKQGMRRRRSRVVRNNATSAHKQTTEGPVESGSVKNALKHSKAQSLPIGAVTANGLVTKRNRRTEKVLSILHIWKN
jgi:hypothetical protein